MLMQVFFFTLYFDVDNAEPAYYINIYRCCSLLLSVTMRILYKYLTLQRFGAFLCFLGFEILFIHLSYNSKFF